MLEARASGVGARAAVALEQQREPRDLARPGLEVRERRRAAALPVQPWAALPVQPWAALPVQPWAALPV
ncbi:MAG TPA: hypothetical protein VKZ49_06895, partial [Polyangiaceae bacterium]|nr:hypothetical protein [Polyangiaceae bacterium]